MAEPAKEIAKAKYSVKVCGYLGLDPKRCAAVFDRLYANMKVVFEGMPLSDEFEILVLIAREIVDTCVMALRTSPSVLRYCTGS